MKSCTDVKDSYVSKNSTITSCTAKIQTIFIHPNSNISAVSNLQNCIIDSNCDISSGSQITNSVIMSHSHIASNSLINNSVIGPDSALSCGEVHCSLLGSQSNAHHQSLQVSLLAPLGRGNIGYGANVGSNHTGRSPDQEIHIGEGIFLGLSVVMKFPIDLSFCPYSIVAAGTEMIPQRCSMPFSLFGGSLPNENGLIKLIPGWVWKDSGYTMARSWLKFRDRRKSVLHSWYCDYPIVRPSTVDMMMSAKKRLMTPKLSKAMEENYDDVDNWIYTDREIPGLGKTFVTERDRLNGIIAYRNAILLYALTGMLHPLESYGVVKFPSDTDNAVNINLGLSTKDRVIFPWDENYLDVDGLWDHQSIMIACELPDLRGKVLKLSDENSREDLSMVLNLLLSLKKEFTKSVFKSKKKDDIRGKKTNTFYERFHDKAENDKVVVLTKKEEGEMKFRVKKILGGIGDIEKSKL